MQGELSGLRVLLVEDELLIALAMEDVLDDLGMTVVGPAATLASAEALATSEALDIAVLDMNLRDQLVFPVAEVLNRRGVPMIFCTGYAEMSLIPDNFNRVPCVSKPSPPDEVRRALLQAMETQGVES